MGAPVFIVGVGARTALGLHAASSAVAVRAGISGTAVHPHVIDAEGDPMVVAPDSLLDIELVGPERLLSLADAPLAEACEPLVERHVSGLPLYVGLPALRPGFDAHDAAFLQREWARGDRLPVRLNAISVALRGHAAGLAALAIGADRIRDGTLEMCLAGGVDSYLHPSTLEWLDERRLVAGRRSRTGFVPGEAAGFCLLASAEACRTYGLQPTACILQGAIGSEARLVADEQPCLGEGMTAVVDAALGGLPSRDLLVDEVYLDQNGERYRGEEWGFVCLRMGQRFRDVTTYHAPAGCWGDVGAASGPLFAMLACQSARGDHATGPIAMLCSGSEAGMRCAVSLSTSV